MTTKNPNIIDIKAQGHDRTTVAFSLEKSHVSGRDDQIFFRPGEATYPNFVKAQDIFDALRKSGHVDKPRTIRDEILDMEVGQRFKIKTASEVYVRVDHDKFKAEDRDYAMTIATLAEHYEVEELLPALPKGDEIVRDLNPGVKFTVDGAAFIRTTNGQSADLATGTLYASSYFANKTVEVSK